MRLYIAGPMSGRPEFNRPAFNEAEAKLQAAGYDVLNPARQPDGLEYEEYMRRGFEDIGNADGVALLPGWRESSGARREVSFADSIYVDASDLQTWLLMSLTTPTEASKFPSLILP